MNDDNLIFYQTYKNKAEYLKGIARLYYAGKCTPAQAKKFEAIRSGLLADWRIVLPTSPDHGTPYYLIAAIEASITWHNRNEQELNDRVVANGATARQQLAHWK